MFYCIFDVAYLYQKIKFANHFLYMVNEAFRRLDEFLAEPRNLFNEDDDSEKSIHVNGEKTYVLWRSRILVSYKFNNIVNTLTSRADH